MYVSVKYTDRKNDGWWGGLVCGREREIDEKGERYDSKRELKVDRKIVGHLEEGSGRRKRGIKGG